MTIKLAFALVIVVVVVAPVPSAGQSQAVDLSFGEWYRMPEIIQISWTNGAISAFIFAGWVGCPDGNKTNVGDVRGDMAKGYLTGKYKSTDNALMVLLRVEQDRQCFK